MAYVNIKNATIENVYEGKGFRASTAYKTRDGADRKEYYKIWTPEPVAVGDVVDVSGVLTVRLEEFEGSSPYAAIHVNNPKIEVLI